ncbi:MAG: ABC transporter permease [Nanoarchaeota archaeon]|nr:ABC transporter permease [Nanoarchaeota archaeon]
MKLLYEIYKNFKLIFRNWSSLLLIVLAPLLLILIVGYSFSGDQLHDINIGVIADKNIDLSGFSEQVSDFGTLYRYPSLDSCIPRMIDERVHMCLVIEGSLSPKPGEIPSGEITFYYDNTREKISLLLMSELKDYFGLTAEQISLISTQEIISSLQELLVFLNHRIDDVDSIKNESQKIMGDLQERKTKLIEVRDDFTPRYLYVKDVQKEFNNNADALEADSDSLIQSLEDLKKVTQSLKEEAELFNLTNSTEALDLMILRIDSQINVLKDSTQNTVDQANNISVSLNQAVVELDSINLLLNEEINRTDDYIILINESVKKIDNISTEAREKMAGLSEIDPSLAGKIAKPISQSFKSLVSDVRDIQIAFPVLLAMVIVFISLLFSNIITSLEINNDAYTRNILAPVNDIIYTLGLLITNFLIISFQVIVLLIVAQLRFDIDIIGNLAEIIPISASLILIFICIGMMLAYLSRSIQSSILMSTFLALAIFLFSDALNALEAMPKLASQIAAYNPVVIVNSMFRQVLFFDAPLIGLKENAGLLLLYLAASAFLLVIVSKIKNKQRL